MLPTKEDLGEKKNSKNIEKKNTKNHPPVRFDKKNHHLETIKEKRK